MTKDGHGYHHLLPTPQPWGTRKMKVTYSLDTTPTLSVMVLALAKNFCLYQESSTRISAMGQMTNPQEYNDNDKLLKKIKPLE
jgi:hypothetical protein